MKKLPKVLAASICLLFFSATIGCDRQAESEQEAITFSNILLLDTKDKNELFTEGYHESLRSHIDEFFSANRRLPKEKLNEIFGVDEPLYSSIDEHGVERLTYHFSEVVSIAEQQVNELQEIEYIPGIMVAYKNDDIVHWESSYGVLQSY